MAVAAAERMTFQTDESILTTFGADIYNQAIPDVLIVPEMLTDQNTRSRAARFIGAAVLGSGDGVELCSVEQPIESLHDAIHMAAEGDEQAKALIEMNVKTDVIERTIKTGHVMSKVPLLITSEGKIVQYGQSMDSIQANSLRFAAEHPIMRARTEAETRNAFRIEELYGEGFFDDYSFVVISRAENLPEAGFFTETMSCSIQLTIKDGPGLAMESAFVAGIANGQQHDAGTVVRLGAALGADFDALTPAQIIDTPLMIRNDLIPNGVIDLVRRYDDAATMPTGAAQTRSFFGEDKPAQDYSEYLEKCRLRERTFEPRVQKITAELMAAKDLVASPLDAVNLLHDLSELHMVEQAVVDHSIDVRVFGHVSAQLIEQARSALEKGDDQAARELTTKAVATADSSSCPSSKKASEASESESKGENEDCEFVSKSCPLCKTKNVKTKVQKLKLSQQKRISGSCGCVKIA